MAVLLQIKSGYDLFRGGHKHLGDDDENLQPFSRLLIGHASDQLCNALRDGIPVRWEQTYDLINPFGDRREALYRTSWIFDLEKDSLIFSNKDRLCSAPLDVARKRLLNMADFTPLSLPRVMSPQMDSFKGPYWSPEIQLNPWAKPFIGQVMRDFAYVWRHLLRRQMNDMTFTKLAYATIWMSTMDFSILDRVAFDYSPGGIYVHVKSLPDWETPNATMFKLGQKWIILAQDAQDGLEQAQRHTKGRDPSTEPPEGVIYAILTLRYIILCKAQGEKLQMTRPEIVFDGEHPPPDKGLNLLLWVTNQEPQTSFLNRFPMEVQDNILFHATASSVSAAKLGCEVGFGSPYAWFAGDMPVNLEEVKKKRTEFSPVESQIWFGTFFSGISYKPGQKRLVRLWNPGWPGTEQIPPLSNET
ncbi:hypothetical protein G7046_g3311 [Stylonectria norvegica]|nr:hypothetical protein G7046_g3311 [Stylonectria norvegica]